MPLLSIVLLLMLLFLPGTSSQGAAAGLMLWFQTVLPTIAPFMICTQWIMHSGGIRYLARPAYVILHPLFDLSENGCFILLSGLLCGYPLGAKLCAEFRQKQWITKEEASYLFLLSNHPSPMFLAGYLSSLIVLPIPKIWFLLCFYLPLPIGAWLYRRQQNYMTKNVPLPDISCHRHKSHASNMIHAKTSDPIHVNIPDTDSQIASGIHTPSISGSAQSLEDIIANVCETMVLIGNYMMLCSILSAWIRKLPFLPISVSSLLAGLTEITTGSAAIARHLPSRLSIPCIIGIVRFGGLSGILQTKGVTKNAGLSIRHYVLFQLFQASLSVLSWIILSWITAHLPELW